MLDVDYVNFREHLAGEFNTAVSLECSPLESRVAKFLSRKLHKRRGAMRDDCIGRLVRNL